MERNTLTCSKEDFAQVEESLITSVNLEKRYSKIDQDNVEVLKEQWGKWADIHFSPK